GGHGHAHVYFVARGRAVDATEVALDGRYTVRRSGRRADLGGEIGESGEVVSGKGCFHRKARAGDLHPIARISSEADDDGLACLPGPRWRGGCHCSKTSAVTLGG